MRHKEEVSVLAEPRTHLCRWSWSQSGSLVASLHHHFPREKASPGTGSLQCKCYSNMLNTKTLAHQLRMRIDTKGS